MPDMANPRGMLYVLDTRVLIWYFIGSRRLRGELRERIDETRRQGVRLLVPTIVLAAAEGHSLRDAGGRLCPRGSARDCGP